MGQESSSCIDNGTTQAVCSPISTVHRGNMSAFTAQRLTTRSRTLLLTVENHLPFTTLTTTKVTFLTGGTYDVIPSEIGPHMAVSMMLCNTSATVPTGVCGCITFRVLDCDLNLHCFFSNPLVGTYKTLGLLLPASIVVGDDEIPWLYQYTTDVHYSRRGGVEVMYIPAGPNQTFVVRPYVYVQPGGPLPTKTKTPLRIATYNVIGLPPLAAKLSRMFTPPTYDYGPLQERIPMIASYLQILRPTCDVVVMTEVFEGGAVLAEVSEVMGVIGGWTFMSETPIPDGTTSTALNNGGVRVFSRYPIKRQQVMQYAWSCHGDCLAAKGVVYCELQVDQLNSSLHVFGTHLQAWEDDEAKAVRRKQLVEFRRFIETVGVPPGDPIILAGDFNINLLDVTSAEYREFIAILDVVAPNLGIDEKGSHLGPHGTLELLDGVLSVKNYNSHICGDDESCDGFAVSMQSMRPENGDALSDHYPVVGDIVC